MTVPLVLPMAACSQCGVETQQYNSGVPVCPKCSKACTVRDALIQDVLETTAKKTEAFKRFEEITLRIPSGLPFPDGVQRITNASNDLRVARKEMARAYARLADYLDRGIVPKDLKRTR